MKELEKGNACLNPVGELEGPVVVAIQDVTGLNLFSPEAPALEMNEIFSGDGFEVRLVAQTIGGIGWFDVRQNLVTNDQPKKTILRIDIRRIV